MGELQEALGGPEGQPRALLDRRQAPRRTFPGYREVLEGRWRSRGSARRPPDRPGGARARRLAMPSRRGGGPPRFAIAEMTNGVALAVGTWTGSGGAAAVPTLAGGGPGGATRGEAAEAAEVGAAGAGGGAAGAGLLAGGARGASGAPVTDPDAGLVRESIASTSAGGE